ncbi:MAG: Ig-like domain-containing protein [Leptospiraceae bacterium]|nr:Ig-like domain-containing protein [Leptospiraceae bacterium]
MISDSDIKSNGRVPRPVSRIRNGNSPRGKTLLLLIFAGNSLLQCDKASDLPSLLLDSGSSNAPHITLSSPMPGQNAVRLDLPIFVEFDRSMDRRSVEDSFAFSGSASSDGVLRWAGNRLIFEKEQNLVPGANYELTVRRTAADENGVRLRVPYYLSFFAGSRIDAPEVQSMKPAPNAQNAPPDSSIEINFSRPMSPSSVEKSLSISPAIEGNTVWQRSHRSAVFLPFRPLEPGRTYSVTVSREASDTEGISLANRFSASFQVGSDFEPPSISNAFETGNPSPLAPNQQGISKDSDLVLRFDESMNYGKTADACSLRQRSASRTIKSLRRWNEDFTALRLEPSAPLEPETEYTLRCSTQAMDSAGNRLQTPFSLTFRVDNSAGARNSDYLGLQRIGKVYPEGPQELSIDNADITTLPLPAPSPSRGWTINLEIEFNHALDAASLLPENITIVSVAGPFPNSAYLKSMHLGSSGELSGNVISLKIAGLHPDLYRLRLQGGRSGIKSDLAPGETGTWMHQTRTIYFRPEAQ